MPIGHRVTALVSAVLLCSSWTARAEMGTGTVQDPVTYQYLDGVTKDWQEGIVLDPNTGNYLITYKIDDGIFASIAFEPATKIAPILSWKFEDLKENGAVCSLAPGARRPARRIRGRQQRSARDNDGDHKGEGSAYDLDR